MHLRSLFTAVLITASFITKAQCPGTAVILTSQAQVNAFPASYPGCTVIPDGVDLEVMGSSITNVDSLSQLTAVLGVLEIRNCPLLEDLEGLNNITVLGNDALDGFILRSLPALTNISALNNLQTITGEFTIRSCNALGSLTGLNNLDSVNGSVIIRDNAILQDLNGLSSLQYIGETLELVENTQLSSVSGLSNVTTIVGGPEGGIFIENNDALTNLTGLGNNSTTVGGNLDLLLNNSLSLCSVPVVCNYLANPPLGAVITINGNLTGCNTEGQILASCTFVSISEKSVMETPVQIAPNPVTDRFRIISKEALLKAEMYDVYGRKTAEVIQPENEFDISGYSSGLYFLKISEAGGKQQIVRLIKE